MGTLPKCELVTLKSALALNHSISILPIGLGKRMYLFTSWRDGWMNGWLGGWNDACEVIYTYHF